MMRAELVAGAGVAALLTIGAIIYAGRAIGPAEYADFSAGLAAVYLVGLAFSPVLPTVARVVTRFAARGDLGPVMAMRRDLLRWTLGVSALVLVVAAALLVPLARWLHFRSPFTLLLALGTALLYVVMNVDRGVLQGVFRFREYNLNIVLEAAVRAIGVVVFTRQTPSAAAAMAAWALGSLVAQIAMTMRLRATPSSAGATAWSEFRQLLRPMVLLMFAIAVFQNVDVIAVKRWFGAGDAGAYGAASTLVRGFGVLFVPLYVLAGPLLTRLHEERRSVFGPTLRLAFGYLAFAALPLLIVSIVPRQLIGALYGAAYLDGASVLAPLAGVTIVTYTALMLSQAQLTLGDTRFLLPFTALAVLQIVALAIFHASFTQVLTALWVVQTAALATVALSFVRAWTVYGRK